MSRADWRDNGAYIPFPLPVQAPGGDPNSGTLWTVCFNQNWLPFVLGALKTLTRPETWGTGDFLSDLTVQRAQQLLQLFAEGCNPVEPDNVNWILDLIPLEGQPNTWHLDSGGPGNPTATYSGLFEIPDVFGSVDAIVHGLDSATEDLEVGGLMTDVLFEKASGIESAITVIATDCFDHTSTITDFTPYHVTDVLWKKVRVLALVDLVATISIQGPWQCGPV